MRTKRYLRESIKEDSLWSSEKFLRRTIDELRFKKESVRKAERVIEILDDNFGGSIRSW